MVKRFVEQDQADMYDRAVVTVRGLLTKWQLERDGLRNKLAASNKGTAQAVLNEDAARNSELVAACDSSFIALAQVRNCWHHFREWISVSCVA